jgi:hypothetical protein
VTYYTDLSDYVYFPSRVRMRNVGWLGKDSEFPQGDAPAGLYDALLDLAQDPRNRARGFHECEFCDAGSPIVVAAPDARDVLLGMSELHVIAADGCVYAAPSLVLHYVAEHGYLPPDVFVNAVRFAAAQPPPVREMLVRSEGRADEVLGRMEEVRTAVLAADRDPKTFEARFAERAPAWFIDACGPTSAWDEAQTLGRRGSGVTADVQRAVRNGSWSYAEWVDEMTPGRQRATWWRVIDRDDRTARLSVEVRGWPAPLGALGWLARSAGGTLELEAGDGSCQDVASPDGASGDGSDRGRAAPGASP